MANMIPISTVTVGSGGASSIDFNNIPQIYTDLCVKVSVRTTNSNFYENLLLRLNNDSGSNYTVTRLYADSTPYSDRFTSQTFIYIGEVVGNTATSNTFSNMEIYIPNYTSSSYKNISGDHVMENNHASQNYVGLKAGLYNSTSPINAIKLYPSNTLMQYSTATLYGIRKY